jgi:hypothetical protein
MYTNGRFKDALWTNKPLLKNYFFYNWGCGEPSGGGYAHATLLKPGAWARSPLLSRLPLLEEKVDRITFIYGTRDWMNMDDVVTLRAKANNTTWLDVVRVADGGHNMMVDNPLGFVECAMHALGEHPGGNAGRASVTSGHIYGALPLYHERSTPLPVGLWAQAETGPRELTRCFVKTDNKDGTAHIEWEAESGRADVENYPAYMIRPAPAK